MNDVKKFNFSWKIDIDSYNGSLNDEMIITFRHHTNGDLIALLNHRFFDM